MAHLCLVTQIRQAEILISNYLHERATGFWNFNEEKLGFISSDLRGAVSWLNTLTLAGHLRILGRKASLQGRNEHLLLFMAAGFVTAGSCVPLAPTAPAPGKAPDMQRKECCNWDLLALSHTSPCSRA